MKKKNYNNWICIVPLHKPVQWLDISPSELLATETNMQKQAYSNSGMQMVTDNYMHVFYNDTHVQKNIFQISILIAC